MSKTVATFIGVVSVVIVLHAFRAMHESNITGKIITLDKNVWIYAVNGKDSLKTMVSNGRFKLTVKPGSWKVLIGNNHLLHSVGKTVEVPEGSTLDLGTLKLN